MTKKWFLAFAIVGASMAGAKSFDLTLSSPSTAGNVQLQPGEYKVKLENSKALFTDVQTNQSVETNVTVETVSHKFNYTAVETTKVEGKDQIDSIELGGTTTKLEFK